MKKLIAILLVAVMSTVALTGCKEKPENGSGGSTAVIKTSEQKEVQAVVKELLDNYKNADIAASETLVNLISSSVIENDESLKSYSLSDVTNMFSVSSSPETAKAVLSKFDYTITEITVEGETASVNLSITNAKADDIISDILKNYSKYKEDPSFAKEKIESMELDTFTTDGVISLNKSGDTWEATTVDEKCADGILFGIISWARGFVGA